MKKGKDCGINCAGIAYTTLFFSESAKSYEHHIADVYNVVVLLVAKSIVHGFLNCSCPIYMILKIL